MSPNPPLPPLHPPVFFISSAIIIGTLLLTLFNLDTARETFTLIKGWMTATFGWLFISSVNLYLLATLLIGLSPLGRIRIGGKGARPEFSTPTWIAMLFSAGMGIGLVFWSVAEPISHFNAPLLHEPGTQQAAREAMKLTFFHWGLHAWSIYALVALALAYFCFNRGLPLTMRSAFHPILKDRIHGPIGDTIDILAVVATLFGVSTSLGFGVRQVNAGLHELLGISQSSTVQIILIALITLAATLSVVTGVKRGIKLLSEFNIIIAFILLLTILIIGPTTYLFDAFVENLGYYLQRLMRLSFWTETYSTDPEGHRTTWQHSWTIFYWAWWIAWSPFVGMFIARISLGRTVRELLLGVLFVPTLVTFAWLSIFGNAALHAELFGTGGISEAVDQNTATAIYALYAHYPFSSWLSGFTVLVVISFFVTSSDSGSLVIDIITAGGNTNPPVAQRIYWAALEGFVAAILLIGGGLGALQTVSILSGLPFALLLLLMIGSLYKGLSTDEQLQPSQPSHNSPPIRKTESNED